MTVPPDRDRTLLFVIATAAVVTAIAALVIAVSVLPPGKPQIATDAATTARAMADTERAGRQLDRELRATGFDDQADEAAAAYRRPNRGTFSTAEARQLLDMPRLNRAVRPAPVGMPKPVAAAIIGKDAKLVCAEVTDAYRVRDESIVARCRGGETYRVGALFDMGQRAMACDKIAPLTQQRPC